MAEYFNYFFDIHSLDTVVRDSLRGVEEISRENPVWQRAWEGYWREVCLGQGDNCLRPISYEEAKAYLASWGIDIDGA